MAYPHAGASADASSKRLIRYSPHYITGLGDGNVKQGRNAPPRKEDDDVSESYLRYGVGYNNVKNRNNNRASRYRREKAGSGGSTLLSLSSSSSSWGGFFGTKSNNLGSGAGDYDPMGAAAPWQLSAFALLGAVVLLSALFLHVLADTAAENAHRQQQQRSRQQQNRTASSRTTNTNTTMRKEKLKDEDDSHSEAYWQGSYYEDVMTPGSEITATTTATSTTQQQQPMQQPPSLYFPYQQGSRLRRVAGVTGGSGLSHNSSSSSSYNNNHRVYHLNPPYMAGLSPIGSKTTRAVASPGPPQQQSSASAAAAIPPLGITRSASTTTSRTGPPSNSKSLSLTPNPKHLVVESGKHVTAFMPHPAYHQPAPQQQHRNSQQSVNLLPKPEVENPSSFPSNTSDLDESKNCSNRRTSFPDYGGGSSTTIGPMERTLPTVISAGHWELTDSDEGSMTVPSPTSRDAVSGPSRRSGELSVESSYVYVSDETPLQTNRKRKESSPMLEMPVLPVLCKKANECNDDSSTKQQQQQQQNAENYHSTLNNNDINGSPHPVAFEDLTDIMESGNIPLHWHSSHPAVVAPSAPSSGQQQQQQQQQQEEEGYFPLQFNCEEVSSNGSVAENDPRFNIDHVRPNLITGSNATAALQAAVDFSELQLVEVIGGGGFGQVWKAMWRSTPVAVKVLTGSAQSQKVPRAVLEEFAAEINLLKGMRHPNICLYMGACLQPPNRAIITELAANGSLWDALRLPLNSPFRAVGRLNGLTDQEAWPAILYQPDPRHGMPPSAAASAARRAAHSAATGTPRKFKTTPAIPEGQWPWVLVKKVACGTARGMVYLHSGVPPVLHRDLKSANILLDESYTPKVCDFGLSRLQSTTNSSMTGNCGTVQWMAPEVLANQKYNAKADVFSYGIIMWELLTRVCPYEGMGAVQCALAVLNRDHRPPIPQWCPPFLQALIRACLKTDPKDRPTFEQILATLQSMP